MIIRAPLHTYISRLMVVSQERFRLTQTPNITAFAFLPHLSVFNYFNTFIPKDCISTNHSLTPTQIPLDPTLQGFHSDGVCVFTTQAIKDWHWRENISHSSPLGKGQLLINSEDPGFQRQCLNFIHIKQDVME